MTKRSHYLTALLLALWLPAQALATVLVHCVTAEDAAPGSGVSHVMAISHTDAATEDCHGKPAAKADPVTTPEHHDADAADCFHCTGGCHKIQHMLTLERDAQRNILQTTGPVSRSNDLAAGYPDFPIRPPKHNLSV